MRPFAARAGRLPDDASFNIRYSTLDAIDAGDGRFTCHVDLFDARTRAELAWAEAAVQTPEPAAMPVARRAAPNAAPAVFAAPRGLDCGTGNDPGCVEQNGSRPMDGIAFSGLISSLRSASGD